MPALQGTPGAGRTPSSTPTPTPSNTPTPTPSPTPTLPQPPHDGGLVAVDSIFVRAGPSRYWSVLGWLAYGESVYPIVRATDSRWVMIDFGGVEGWMDSTFVMWGDGVDIDGLTERAMPNPPPTETTLPRTATPRPTDSPALTPISPALVSPSETPTSVPSATPTFTPSATIRAMVTPATSTSTSGDTSGDDANSDSVPSSSISPGSGLAIGGVGMLLLGFYGWRFVRGTRNLRRYSDGFVVDWCPVCRTGRLHLDEHVNRVLGVPRVHRTVRCNECRSVLREMRPGEWRYAVDPVADEAFAAEHNGNLFYDAGLIELVSQRRAEEWKNSS